MTLHYFTDLFAKYCEGFPSPKTFLDWGGIACVSGALTRRVWAVTRNNILYPNTIIILVAPPAIGKSMVLKEVVELWSEALHPTQRTPCFNVAPTSVTKASLIDALKQGEFTPLVSVNNQPATIFTYHSLLIAVPEFGVFCPSHDTEFLNTINDLYDCRANYAERRRTLKEVINIARPHISIVGGTQPAFLGSILPEAAFGMGFMSRCLMIYADTCPQIPLFSSSAQRQHSLRAQMLSKLGEISELYGEFSWQEKVKTEIQSFVSAGMPPRQEHLRLYHYNARRDLQLLKLCLIFAGSRASMEVNMEDYERAKEHLLDAERRMPEIFKDMAAGPDTQTIADLVYQVKILFAKTGKQVHEARLVDFLHSRVPAHKVLDIIATAVRADMLECFANTNGTKTYAPKVRSDVV